MELHVESRWAADSCPGKVIRVQTGKEVGMHPGIKTLLGATLVAPSFMIALTSPRVSYGDEPSRLGRLFRFGGNQANSAPPTPSPTTPAARAPKPSDPPSPLLFSGT